MTLDMFEQDGVNAGQSELYGQDVHILRGFSFADRHGERSEVD